MPEEFLPEDNQSMEEIMGAHLRHLQGQGEAMTVYTDALQQGDEEAINLALEKAVRMHGELIMSYADAMGIPLEDPSRWTTDCDSVKEFRTMLEALGNDFREDS